MRFLFQPQRRRLRIVIFLGAVVAFVLTSGLEAAYASDRPASFIKSVSRQVMAAVRSGSPYSMADVVRRYGDLPYISLYSLGTYRNHLPRSRRTSYYDGVARFMARYFISQSRVYPVARIDVFGPSVRSDEGYKVDSRFTLRNGDTYTVRWLVVPRGKGFRIRDASLLGFWLMPFQRRLFENYISDHGGKITALLAVLGS